MVAHPLATDLANATRQSAPPTGVAAGALASALMNSERRFHAIVETSLQGKLVHRRFRPLFANTAFAYMVGCDRSEDILDRESIIDFMDDEARANPDAVWVRLLHGPALYGRRTMYRRDGASFVADIYARAIQWDSEPAVAMAVIDVTEEERAQQELRDAKAQADSAARAKRRFLAAASHELRTPLHGALGRLQILADSVMDPRTEVLVRDALDSCRDLSRRIDDVLDAAAMDAHAIALTHEPFWLKTMVEAAISDIRIAADSAGVRIAEPMTDAGTRLMGDPRAVRRITAALLEAAVRRLPSRWVAVEAQTDEAGLAISVRAEGALRAPGDDGSQDDTFNPLATARRLAGAHGGVLVEWTGTPLVWSASAYLPLERLDENDGKAPRRVLDVLVAEDNPGARALLKVALETLGHRPTLAVSGTEALEIAETRAFDVVLMDLAMPGMDGFEATRRIRALPLAHARMPIAALTASCAPGVREQIAEAGMDAFLRKPVDIPQLAETIALLAGRSVHAAEGDQVHQNHHGEESADHANRGHRSPQNESKDDWTL